MENTVHQGTGNAPIAPCVLVIEDDAPLRMLVAQALELEGIQAVVAGDPAQALALCAGGTPFAVVLLDWRLGRTTGREFAAAYRMLPAPHAPIVLVTGQTDVVDNVEQIGACGFLKKPFDLGELIQTVERFVRREAAHTDAHSTAAPAAPPVVVESNTGVTVATVVTDGAALVAQPPAAARPAVTRKSATLTDARRRLLARMGVEVASIQVTLPRLHAQVMALANLEETRRLTAEERSRRRDLGLQMQAHQLRLQDLRAEFETLRAGHSN